jgi:hypothetical protein
MIKDLFAEITKPEESFLVKNKLNQRNVLTL